MIQDFLSTSESLDYQKNATAAYKFERFLHLCFGFFSTRGPRQHHYTFGAAPTKPPRVGIAQVPKESKESK
jgi:hypothetical protein